MTTQKIQPKLSIRFSSPHPAWNGDAAYKTASQFAQAVRNVPDVVPAHVLAKAVVTVRGSNGTVEPMDDWLRRDGKK